MRSTLHVHYLVESSRQLFPHFIDEEMESRVTPLSFLKGSGQEGVCALCKRERNYNIKLTIVPILERVKLSTCTVL